MARRRYTDDDLFHDVAEEADELVGEGYSRSEAFDEAWEMYGDGRRRAPAALKSRYTKRSPRGRNHRGYDPRRHEPHHISTKDRELYSKVASLAQDYRKDGMSLSRAMKKAWQYYGYK